ncbi:organic cation transporter protein-like [Atheta coriaria]|uniref:organic cation transporter protein-like n=1 Tax=Dalotia coriaria TaxID=877792 RepID=UPI0031F475F5
MDLDKILLDIGGLGKYQIKRYALLCLVLIFATFPTLSYVFTARDVDYRCYIDGCDLPNTIPNYNASWVQYSVPYKNGLPSKCQRYQRTDTRCNGWAFNRNQTVGCDRFVYRNKDDSTIATDFNIVCEENLWKLTIVGSINNIGFLLGLPLSGFISDRYGRKTLMLFAILFSTIMGITKSLSPNYLFFVTFEFLDMMLGAGLYTAAYILGMELLVPEYRVMGSTIMSSAFALGEALIGVTAWFVPWRIFLRILYIPGVLFVSCYWLTDESVRWMISNDRNEEAACALKKIAAQNGRRLDEAVVKRLHLEGIGGPEHHHHTDTFLEALRSPALLIRLANCSLAWISCTFVYYGLTMHSVGISGNVYVNFIAVSLIEIPAYVLANVLLNKLGRRATLAASFMTSGLACVGFVFIPESDGTLRLIVFLLGKFSATVSYATIYLYTTEMFPTSLRHTFMSTCSMFGRIGSIIAPQVPILAQISQSLPLFLFASMAGTSGLLSLFFPETLNVKLPDTIVDAVNMGRQENNNKMLKA